MHQYVSFILKNTLILITTPILEKTFLKVVIILIVHIEHTHMRGLTYSPLINTPRC